MRKIALDGKIIKGLLTISAALLCLAFVRMNAHADDNTTWQRNFTYELDDENGYIDLYAAEYFGSDNLVVPAKAVISGIEYKTRINDELFSCEASNGTRYFPKTVEFEDGIEIASAEKLFYKCYRLESVKFGDATVADFASFKSMFQECKALTSIVFGEMDTSKVVDMSYMFCDCGKLGDVDLSTFDTSSVIDVTDMFKNNPGIENIDLSSFDLSRIEGEVIFTDMNYIKSIKTPKVSPESGLKIQDLNSGDIFFCIEQGSKTKYVNIAEAPASTQLYVCEKMLLTDDTCTIELDADTYEYSGEPVKPEPVVKYVYSDGDTIVLEKGKDYFLEYFNNETVGNACVVVHGIGQFDANPMKFFKIVFAKSPDYIEGFDAVWNHYADGKSYWYEKGYKQGTVNDEKSFEYEGTIRGREIYDPESDAWYWLDANADGAKAVNKEVFMPYIYQDELENLEDEEWVNGVAALSRQMGKKVLTEKVDLSAQVRDAILKHGGEGAGKWVRYDEDGKMVKGWYRVQGKDEEYYPDQIGNVYYYDQQTGLMAKGWTTIDGLKYHFDETSGVLDDYQYNDLEKGATGTIFNTPGNEGYTYAVEADVELTGEGTGYHGKLVIGGTYAAISWGIQYDKGSGNKYARGKCALMTENIDVGNKIYDYNWYDINVGDTSASAHLMLVLDSSTGDIWFFHNYQYVGHVNNSGLIGTVTYMRGEGAAQGGSSYTAVIRNARTKCPHGEGEMYTFAGTPSADSSSSDMETKVVNKVNGYRYSVITGSNSGQDWDVATGVNAYCWFLTQ